MLLCGSLLVAATAFLLGAAAANPEEDAWALFARVHELNHTTRAWTDRTQELNVRIIDRRNNERRRTMELFTRKNGDDSSRSLLFPFSAGGRGDRSPAVDRSAPGGPSLALPAGSETSSANHRIVATGKLRGHGFQLRGFDPDSGDHGLDA
jgi:hypothetical protein